MKAQFQPYQIVAFFLVLLLAGCFAGAGGKEEAAYPQEAEADYAVSEKRMSGEAKAPAAVTAEGDALGAEGPAGGDDTGLAQEPRKRIFAGFGRLLVDEVEAGKREIAHIAEENVASQRLIEGVGFYHEGTLREHYIIQGRRVSERVYGLLRDEWCQNAAPDTSE